MEKNWNCHGNAKNSFDLAGIKRVYDPETLSISDNGRKWMGFLRSSVAVDTPVGLKDHDHAAISKTKIPYTMRRTVY